MNKALIHNECYSNGAVVAHIQSMLLRNLRHTMHTSPKAFLYMCIIYIYTYSTSACIHVVSKRSWPAHSAMKRERVVANAALTLASGGKLKALLGQPFEILFSWAIVGGEHAQSSVCSH